MYVATLYNNGTPTEIHGLKQKVKSGSIVQGVNSINSFSFALLPSNSGFNKVQDFVTLAEVFNTHKNRYEFQGRVLYSNTSMEESGSIKKDVTCESFLGFLCDSQQTYIEEQNWTVKGLWQHIIDNHNALVEDYKHFKLGVITVSDPNDNIYCGIQRENTFETIKKKLIDVLGDEIRFRVVDGEIYIDHLIEIGETKTTPIELSRNMKAITREVDPSAYVTRLIPLGCKLSKEVTTTEEDGTEKTELVETEERLDISSVNDGKIYIDDAEAIAKFGIHIGYVEWDDVTDPANLKTKGEKWLIDNNKVRIKYSATALDLSLLGLEIDDFEVHNRHPLINPLLGINDTVRIIKKTIDIVEEVKTNIEFGENFKTLSDWQIEQSGKVEQATQTIKKIESDYVTNTTLKNETNLIHSIIKQTAESILSSVSETYTASDDYEEFKKTVNSTLEQTSESISGYITETNEAIRKGNEELQDQINSIKKYFAFDINGMTIGQVDNPNKVVIDNDEIAIMVNGIAVQKFDAEGRALTPSLSVTQTFDLLGLLIEKDDNGNINCEYIVNG